MPWGLSAFGVLFFKTFFSNFGTRFPSTGVLWIFFHSVLRHPHRGLCEKRSQLPKLLFRKLFEVVNKLGLFGRSRLDFSEVTHQIYVGRYVIVIIRIMKGDIVENRKDFFC